MVHNIDITHHQHDTFCIQNSEQTRKQKQERHRRSQRADDSEVTAGRFFPMQNSRAIVAKCLRWRFPGRQPE